GIVVVDIDQGGDAVARTVERFGRLPDAGAGEVADRLRAVLITAGRDDAIELDHKLVVEGDGHALHGDRPRTGHRPGAVLAQFAGNRNRGGCLKKATRPDGEIRAGRLTDAGVDGGARADRNYQA